MLTEPLTVTRLAGYFGVHRDTMRRQLGRMPGVERFGGLWRVPVELMPPRYLAEKGLPKSADFCRELRRGPFGAAGGD